MRVQGLLVCVWDGRWKFSLTISFPLQNICKDRGGRKEGRCMAAHYSLSFSWLLAFHSLCTQLTITKKMKMFNMTLKMAYLNAFWFIVAVCPYGYMFAVQAMGCKLQCKQPAKMVAMRWPSVWCQGSDKNSAQSALWYIALYKEREQNSFTLTRTLLLSYHHFQVTHYHRIFIYITSPFIEPRPQRAFKNRFLCNTCPQVALYFLLCKKVYIKKQRFYMEPLPLKQLYN